MKTETFWSFNKTVLVYAFWRFILTKILNLFPYLLHYLGCYIYLEIYADSVQKFIYFFSPVYLVSKYI